jgi:hypothetical protein
MFDTIFYTFCYVNLLTTIEVLTKLNYIDPKTFNFIWILFRIPVTKFR